MLPSLQELIDKYDLFAKKSLGQNFLFDKNITDKIVREASVRLGDLSNCTVVEIGPGPGGLSRSILDKKPKKMFFVEKDQRFIPLIEETISHFAGTEVSILNQDALKIDYSSMGQEIVVIANLPYNVATPILINFLYNIKNFKGLVLMFQKEVANRITAQHNTEFYGRLSVISQFLCECQILLDLPPSVFTPAPKVDSAVVYFKPRACPLYPVDLIKLEKTTSILFSQRRKMLRKILKSFNIDGELFSKLHINETLRPENLTIVDFCRLAEVIM